MVIDHTTFKIGQAVYVDASARNGNGVQPYLESGVYIISFIDPNPNVAECIYGVRRVGVYMGTPYPVFNWRLSRVNKNDVIMRKAEVPG